MKIGQTVRFFINNYDFMCRGGFPELQYSDEKFNKSSLVLGAEYKILGVRPNKWGVIEIEFLIDQWCPQNYFINTKEVKLCNFKIGDLVSFNSNKCEDNNMNFFQDGFPELFAGEKFQINCIINNLFINLKMNPNRGIFPFIWYHFDKC